MKLVVTVRNRESSDPQRANLPTSLKMLPPAACSESHPRDSTAFQLTVTLSSLDLTHPCEQDAHEPKFLFKKAG